MPVVRPVVAAPEEERGIGSCETVDLLTSRDGCGAPAKRARVLEEGAADRVDVEGNVVACPGGTREVDVLPKLFRNFCTYCRPCSSFSAKIAKWNSLLVVL